MEFVKEQGLLGKIRYADGEMPSFAKSSFAKLDSLTKVYKKDLESIIILSGGRPIDETELSKILSKLK